MMISKAARGQGMVEFALGITILLFIIMGVIEAGYFMFVKISTEYAVRDAARYGAGMGKNQAGVAYYQDCQGLKDLLKKEAPFSEIQDDEIKIEYDSGPNTPIKGSCPLSALTLGDRLKVTATGHYRPLIGAVAIPPLNWESVSYFTILTNVAVK